MLPQDCQGIALSDVVQRLRLSRFQDTNTDEAWRKGDLSYKMWAVQQKMAKVLTSPGSLKKVLNCSRRIRKTTTSLIKCVEDHVLHEGAPTRYVAPTQKMLRNIVHPLMTMICRDAPKDLKPEWNQQGGYYLFPHNRTEIHIAGANNGHEDDSRGTASRRCVVDEAQLIDRLRYVAEDVLVPQLIDTGGQLWILFTPPKTPIHDVCGYAQEVKQIPGAYAEYNIYESEYPESVINEFCKEAGGAESTTWKREYMCQFVVDTNYAIVPEWRDEYVNAYVPDEFDQFYARYCGMDIGVRDKTVIIFGTYHFKSATLYVEDEFVISGNDMTTDKVAKGIKEREERLWGKRVPKLRVADNNNLILLQDLSLIHQMHFAPTSKDTLEAMVNQLRLWVSKGRVRIDPKCVQTIGSLKYGVWNDTRKDWERSLVYGHFDALAALMYLIRNVDENTNPIPRSYGFRPENMWLDPNEEKKMADTQATEAWRKALGIRG